MKQYNPKWNAPEQLEKINTCAATKEKRAGNKKFRKTGSQLLKYDPESIYVVNHKQKHRWQN